MPELEIIGSKPENGELEIVGKKHEEDVESINLNHSQKSKVSNLIYDAYPQHFQSPSAHKEETISESYCENMNDETADFFTNLSKLTSFSQTFSTNVMQQEEVYDGDKPQENQQSIESLVPINESVTSKTSSGFFSDTKSESETQSSLLIVANENSGNEEDMETISWHPAGNKGETTEVGLCLFCVLYFCFLI